MRMLVGPARAWFKPSLPPAEEGLFSLDNLEYVGSFRVPARADISETHDTFAYAGGYAMSYNPGGDGGAGSLFLSGTEEDYQIAEIDIPEPDGRTGINISDLPVASLLQGFFDPSEGDAAEVASTMRPVGSLVKGAQLLTAYTPFYSNTLAAGHFTHNVNGATPGHGGPYSFNTTFMGVNNKWIAGAMCHVPEHWQSRLGGDALAGSAERSTHQNNSVGPAATAFMLDDVGVENPIPCTHLLGKYREASPPDAAGPDYSIFNEASAADGMFIAYGFKSLVFLGSFGTGALTGVENQKACYGPRTGDPEYIGNPQNNVACYSAFDGGGGQGYYSYPWRANIWAYALEDLEEVKQGLKRIDEVDPYLHAEFPLPAHWKPGPEESQYKLCACIDNTSATKRIFVAHVKRDENSSPLIHVYNVVSA